jgi:hypothetical protein
MADGDGPAVAFFSRSSFRGFELLSLSTETITDGVLVLGRA